MQQFHHDSAKQPDAETRAPLAGLKGIACLQDRLKAELLERSPHVLDACPLERYIAYLDHYPTVARWSYVSGTVRRYCKTIQHLAGDSGLELYHQLLLLTLMTRSRGRLGAMNLPDEIRLRYEASFQRIARSIERKTAAPGYYLAPQLCKDLGICMLRIIPAGMQIVNLFRLPGALFYKSSLRQWLAWVRLVIQMGGISPFYEMHAHAADTKSMLEYSPAGYVQLFRRVAELLRRNPEVKGVVETGWLCDPALEEISPELSYVRAVVVENGGRIFLAGPCSAAGIHDATVFSSTRKRLYEEGKYLPKEYALVWPRKELLAWADQG
jgi:hypothetical protein